MAGAEIIAIPDGFLEIRQEWCKGCYLCVNVCPKNVLSLNKIRKVIVERPEACLKCEMCEGVCPDYVIRVIMNERD